MRYLTAGFLFLFVANFTFAQSIQRINIPLVVETTEIDSLIQIFIPAAVPTKSCFVLNVEKIKGKYFCQVACKETSLSVIDEDLLFSKMNLCYFNYKGYLTLLTGDFLTSTFFKSTRHSKTFKFGKYEKKRDISDAIKGILGAGEFLYENGKFRRLDYTKS